MWQNRRFYYLVSNYNLHFLNFQLLKTKHAFQIFFEYATTKKKEVYKPHDIRNKNLKTKDLIPPLPPPQRVEALVSSLCSDICATLTHTHTELHTTWCILSSEPTASSMQQKQKRITEEEKKKTSSFWAWGLCTDKKKKE